VSKIRERLRQHLAGAATSTVAVLATFGSALGLKYAAGLPAGVLVLAVVLAVTLSRRQPSTSTSARVFALIALPLLSAGATEVGAQVYERPNLGDALFVAAVSASIWARRFRGPFARLGSIAALPLLAILIAPAAVATSSAGAASRWWGAAVAVLALVWVTTCFTIAEWRGWLPAPSADAAARRPRPGPQTVDRMALRMLVSLTLAFSLGRWLFGPHWPWLVIAAFVVSSGGAEHRQVVWRGVQRVVGAGLGTVGATLLTTLAPAGSRWSLVLIFAVLAVATWLRPLNYAFWAGGVTSVLALLYGYFGQRGTGLLLERLEEITLGALGAVAVSWLVTLLPVARATPDPLREATERVLSYANRRHGLGYTLVRSLPSGGYLVRSADGEAVLRWSRESATPSAVAGVLASGATPKGYPYVISVRAD
jgi:hypothetical protein